jgi:phosphoribosylformimino-5-aminoimidazole carboxamide ribotide isomerase
MQIFPAIDLLDGKAVRLEQGRPESAKIYSHSPWELAQRFAAAGAPRLHVVDLDAALSGGAKNNLSTIERILAATTMDVEVGGGLRNLALCERIFSAGAKYAVLGTAAIKSPEVVKEACRLYPKRIVVAVDARVGKVAVEGWTQDTAVDAIDIGRKVADYGAAAVLYTDIGRDGMRTGPNLEATKRLVDAMIPCKVIASGGMSHIEDIQKVRETGASAVIIGKALYEGIFTIEQALAEAKGK